MNTEQESIVKRSESSDASSQKQNPGKSAPAKNEDHKNSEHAGDTKPIHSGVSEPSTDKQNQFAYRTKTPVDGEAPHVKQDELQMDKRDSGSKDYPKKENKIYGEKSDRA